MNSAFVPVACGSALALMAGAAATHWVSVRQTAALVRNLQPVPAHISFPVVPLPEDESTREAKILLAAAKSGDAPSTANESAPSPADARFEQVVSALENVVKINHELRNQVAETNRDLMELQFQVDMQSEHFRPLKVAEETLSIDDGPGVLPLRPTP